MKTQKILAIIVLTMLVSCTKTAEELLVQSEKNMQESRVELAINDLQTLLKKHPTDSLASKAQYKLSSIYLNWKNDPEMGYDQLELTIKNHTESIHGKQALDQIKEFPELLFTPPTRISCPVRPSHQNFLPCSRGFGPSGVFSMKNGGVSYETCILMYPDVSCVYPDVSFRIW